MKQKNRKKKWTLSYDRENKETEIKIKKLAADTNLSEVMARLLYSRGFQNAESVTAFLHQDEVQLHDPFIMQDMALAVARVEKALEMHEKIAIYGDYDVDGVTSVSLLYLYLTSRGGDVGYYIPSRSKEGYGLSVPAIDMLKEEKNVQLMITVDTGITATAETEYASSIGIDTVVTDHHECHTDIPKACAVINPHRPDDEYPFKELAGVGVVFKLVCALEMSRARKAGESDLASVRKICHTYGDLVAIGTIADVMPIVNENRLIVSLGLKLIENTSRHGLRALIEAASGANATKKRKINSGFIGFGLAPRMNAAGRVSTAGTAVELLLSQNANEAKELAERLCELNVQRQQEENHIAEQAYKKIEQTMDPEHDRVIVISEDTWHQGIIGIVASRITERYGLPSILISFDGSTNGEPTLNDIGKGSGRSIRGLNLVEALADSSDLLVRFGGHELAAGLTITRCNIDAFRKKINEYAVSKLDEDALCLSLDADCEVEMHELTMRLATELDRLEPFGIANPVPNFILKNARIARVIPMGGGKHTKLIIEKDGISMVAIWFGKNSTELPVESVDTVDVLFQLNVNEYQNVTSLQMIVQDIRVSASYEQAYQTQILRYKEIAEGGSYDESENILPTREDFVPIYKLLRKEYYNGHTVFPMRRLWGIFNSEIGMNVTYSKLKYIIRIMQELQLCEVDEPAPDEYIFAFRFQTSKTNIEKSSILRKLKMQLRKNETR